MKYWLIAVSSEVSTSFNRLTMLSAPFTVALHSRRRTGMARPGRGRGVLPGPRGGAYNSFRSRCQRPASRQACAACRRRPRWPRESRGRRGRGRGTRSSRDHGVVRVTHRRELRSPNSGGLSRGSPGGAGLGGADDVADADDAGGEDLGAQPAAVQQAVHQPGPSRHAFEILAGLAEPGAAHLDRAHPERAVDQMVERDTDCGDVAAGLGGCDLDAPTLAGGVLDATVQGLDRLRLDQGHLTPAEARPTGIVAAAEEVPIALQALAGYGANFGNDVERNALLAADVQRNDLPLPHGPHHKIQSGRHGADVGDAG